MGRSLWPPQQPRGITITVHKDSDGEYTVEGEIARGVAPEKALAARWLLGRPSAGSNSRPFRTVPNNGLAVEAVVVLALLGLSDAEIVAAAASNGSRLDIKAAWAEVDYLRENRFKMGLRRYWSAWALRTGCKEQPPSPEECRRWTDAYHGAGLGQNIALRPRRGRSGARS
jgi:hypothetical protein